MVLAEQVGTADIRSQFFEKTVKGFADRMYKFKQVVTVSSTSAWKNYFYREDPTVLTGASGNAVKGVPRGAAFPQAVVTWERVQANIVKYGLEDNIYWEDILSNDIDVQARTLFKIAEGVTKAVDDEIYAQLGGNGTISSVTSFSILGRGWDESSGTIIDDLMKAKMLIAQNNYSTENLSVLISPKDHRSIVNYLAEKGAQFPSVGEDMARNGRVGSLAGMQLIMSNSVAASMALVVVPKVCATWKELVPLQTTTIEDKYKSITVRAVEEGVVELTDPNAVVLIVGTQKNAA